MQFAQIMLDRTHVNALTVTKAEFLHSVSYLYLLSKILKNLGSQEMVLIAVIPMNVKILTCVHNTHRARTLISHMSAFVMKDMKVMEKNVLMWMNVKKELTNVLQMLTARIPWEVIFVTVGLDFQVGLMLGLSR